MPISARPKPVAGPREEREESLGQTAYNELLDRLIKREIAVGSVLQERRIAEALDMSRTPVRDALNRLESEGFITRQPGGVLVVKEFSTRELIETLHVRQILEMEGVRLAAGRIPLAELDAVEADIRSLLEDPDRSAGKDWEVDSRLHGLIASHSGNAVLAKHIQDLRLKTHMFNMDRVPERFEIGHREHLAIIDALRREDREAARAGIQTHIENVKLSIIEKLRAI
ncbi:HTH-type transcriptional repressor RspR [Starkeya nomas]|uniref:HTH-type transcriptional repressor RspR n=2 Tax=Xanthobacteraceae TaxID=335928 RepID=A0A5S9N9U2_9HYPH|nr:MULTISPECIES: GntR family transcriptional regulator [Xanthobacteraceae]TSJ64770.1 GntR family transcriptional regulator [Ancylobacter moscoviensis]CAA0086015.1 HTH-type transcriptional repressor RspR [Starkeya nomas]